MGIIEELPRQGWIGRAALAWPQRRARFPRRKARHDTHESKTDPDAKLFRKGKSQPAKLYFMGHALIENRHGLVVQADATAATGKAERQAALAMIDRYDPGSERRLTLAADKGYDTSDFVADLRRKCVTPHVAAKAKGSAIDGRATRHESYRVSQRKRKLVEEAFGWGKTIAGMAKVKVRGLERVRFKFTFAMAAYNLIRMPRLLAVA
jgi:IS5 family transposase